MFWRFFRRRVLRGRRWKEPSEEVVRLFGSAATIARGYGHDYVGTDHLLLGLLADPACAGHRCLRDCGVHPDELSRALEEEIAPNPAGPLSTDVPLLFTPGGARVIDLSTRRATKARCEIGTEHLLHGLLDEEYGIAAEVLRRAGLTSEAIAQWSARGTG